MLCGLQVRIQFLRENRSANDTRPVMRDRSWQYIDAVYESKLPLPDFEWDSRRVSDARIVREMGLHVEQVSSYSMTTTEQERESQRVDELQREAVEDIIHPIRRRSTGFRLSLRRAFMEWIGQSEKRSRSAGAKVYDSSGQQIAARVEANSSSAASDGNVPVTPRSGVDFSRVGDTEHKAGQACSCVNCPPYGTVSDGEVHLADGVALTEEAVDSGLSDIITQI